MQHHAPESSSDLEPEKNQTEPQADGDSNESVGEEAIVDGRISGLPPNYDTDQAVDGEDSPALDAEIQSDQIHDSEEG
jgi:segregation and condensation protein B